VNLLIVITAYFASIGLNSYYWPMRITTSVPKSQLAHELCRKFPDHGNHTIAKLLYKEHPELFSSLEAARCCVRRARGSQGELHRKTAKHLAPGPKVAIQDAFGCLPEGIQQLKERDPLRIKGPATVAILSDIHIPYHDKTPLVSALEFCRKIKPSHIVLNGDIADFFSVSFWEKDPRERDLANEIRTVREFLALLRKQFRQAEIIYKLGNHEERWERYLRVKAPELLGIADFEIDSVLHFSNHGITKVGDFRPIRAGHLNIIHGHEFRWGIQSPVNPARGFYLRGKECCLGGHLHQTSSHNEKSMNDTVVSCWSTGALCDLKPAYAPMNKWNHGFAFVDLDKKGMFEVHNYKLIHGRVFES
jgi:predicted phosphodiesterase